MYFPYILVALLPIYGYLKKDNTNLKPGHIFLIYFAFAALRGNGNGDYQNYIQAIPLMKTISDVINPTNYPFEIGFRIIAYINNTLHFPAQFTIIVLNFISLFVVHSIIERYSSNKWLSWILYYPFLMLFDMHHMRSAVAMNLILLMYHVLFLEKKLILGILIGLSSSAFHKSSILIFALIIVYYIMAVDCDKKDRETIYKNAFNRMLLILTLMIRLFLPPKEFIIKLRSLFPDNSLLVKAASYLSNERWSYPFKLYDPRVALLAIVYFTGEYVIEEKKSKERNYLNMFFMGIIVLIFLSESTILTMRMYNYFNLFIILLVPIIVETPKFYEMNTRIVSEITILRNIRIKPLEFLFVFIYSLYIGALIYKQVPYFLFF